MKWFANDVGTGTTELTNSGNIAVLVEQDLSNDVCYVCVISSSRRLVSTNNRSSLFFDPWDQSNVEC